MIRVTARRQDLVNYEKSDSNVEHLESNEQNPLKCLAKLIVDSAEPRSVSKGDC